MAKYFSEQNFSVVVNVSGRSFCQMLEETLLHLFCECKITREFWNNVYNWLSRGKNSVIQLNSFDICFGYNITTPNFLLNQLILIGKVFIFQCKTAEYMPSIKNYKTLIKDIEKIERHIALQNNRIDRHINLKKRKSVIPNHN